jgi:hypothetical protein
MRLRYVGSAILCLFGCGGSEPVEPVDTSDVRAPTLSVTSSHREPPHVGHYEVVTFRFEATDDARLLVVRFRATGAVQRTDSLMVDGAWTAGIFAAYISRSVRLGDSLYIAIQAADSAGNSTEWSMALEVTDVRYPEVQVSVSTAPGPDALYARRFVPGDTVWVALEASDDRELTWVGYSLGLFGFAESIQPQTSSLAEVFPIVVPPGWEVRETYLTAFAVDSVGNRSEVTSSALGFFDGVRRPLQAVQQPNIGPAWDAVYDPWRDRLYVSQPDSSRIAVLSLASLASEAPVPTPYVAWGMDLSTGGDSLVVVLPGSPFLGIVDLQSALPSIDTVLLNELDYPNRYASDVAVLANDKVLLSIVSQFGDLPEALYEVDLRSGAQRLRTDLPGTPVLTRSGDRSMLVAAIDNEYYVYRVGTDAFSAPLELCCIWTPSIDYAGNRIMIGSMLFDGGLSPIGEIPTYADLTLTADASAAYYPVDVGYARYGIVEGRVMERGLLRQTPAQLWPLPDGERLLVFVGEFALPAYVVDVR